MKTFTEWLLAEKKVVLNTCTNKVVNIPKGKSQLPPAEAGSLSFQF
jgi:hypothetical protein